MKTSIRATTKYLTNLTLFHSIIKLSHLLRSAQRRLGSVITQGFDDCCTVTGRFRLLDSFDTLVRRPIIADDLEKKHGERAKRESFEEDEKYMRATSN